MTDTGPRDGGRILVDGLAAQGVEHVFCVPGESYLAALDALHDSPIALTVCRHEAGAAMMADAADPTERRAAISAAKIAINKAARSLGQEAIQLHGGIAMTWEYTAGHYFKRLTAIESLFGDTAHHLRALDNAGGLIEAA